MLSFIFVTTFGGHSSTVHSCESGSGPVDIFATISNSGDS